MVNKFEAVGIFVCVGIMALALFLLRFDSGSSLLSSVEPATQAASVVSSEGDPEEELVTSLVDSMNRVGELTNLIIDDVVIGTGPEVKVGDSIAVHYIGTLQNGQQFDNSYVRGEPFELTIGGGRVIEGWERGLIGMQKGGQRIIVVPPELAYGNTSVGPIPKNATLVFAIELVAIK